MTAFESVPKSVAARPMLTSRVVDYEPPAQRIPPAPAGVCPAPAILHRHSPRRLRPLEPIPERPPHPGAAPFADMALRRVLEVLDRRRPPAQLRHLMSPPLIDVVTAFSHVRHNTTARLRRVGLRAADAPAAAEVFATYTRGSRVRVIAARVECDGGRWQLTALQLG